MRRFLVILSQAQLQFSGGRIIVKKENEKISLPLRYVDALILVGSWSMTSTLVNAFLHERVPVFFLSRYGTLKGVLFSDYFPSNYRLRLAQYEAFKTKRAEIASFILLEKANEIEKTFLIDLSHYKERIKKTREIEKLLGLEGGMSSEMFNVFKEKLPKNLNFEKREYRPPKDCVNALLSLYYTFHYCLLLPALLVQGFDPYISFLHSKRGRHAAFCSDMLEPLRPHLTRQVLEALRSSLFIPEDFTKDARGVFLKKETFDKFLNFFERNKEGNSALMAEFLAKFAGVISS